MDKLKELIKKELKEVGEKGLSASNLESTSKLIDMLKDIGEIESEGRGEMAYGMRMMPPDMYGNRGGYNERGYNERSYNESGRGYGNGSYMIGEYGARGRSYNGYDNRMRDRIDRVIDGAEMYEYGRDRYQHGGSHEAMEEGLEKMMYAICMLVETAMDAAQSPREKEIVRKHIQKLHSI